MGSLADRAAAIIGGAFMEESTGPRKRAKILPDMRKALRVGVIVVAAALPAACGPAGPYGYGGPSAQNVAGTLIGAGAGAALGNLASSGNAKVPMTVLGGVIGAFTGNLLTRNTGNYEGGYYPGRRYSGNYGYGQPTGVPAAPSSYMTGSQAYGSQGYSVFAQGGMGATDASYTASVERAAYSIPMGETRNWYNPATGNGGSLTPIRQGPVDGQFCREFRVTVTSADGRSREGYVTSCRTGQGWTVMSVAEQPHDHMFASVDPAAGGPAMSRRG